MSLLVVSGFSCGCFLISSVSIYLSLYFSVALSVLWLSGLYLLPVLSGYGYDLWNDIGPFGCFVFVLVCSWHGMKVDTHYTLCICTGTWLLWIERYCMG